MQVFQKAVLEKSIQQIKPYMGFFFLSAQFTSPLMKRIKEVYIMSTTFIIIWYGISFIIGCVAALIYHRYRVKKEQEHQVFVMKWMEEHYQIKIHKD